MSNYYNEIDPYAAQWIRNLIAAGLIPDGEVDERSIEDVTPADLAGFAQCHFFAGIAGWSLALTIAGIPPSLPVWTGSCPCQPFSTAGSQGGFDDERHLWPAFHWLIQECRPAIVVGEQVASKIAEPWLDLVSADMEGLGYAFGALAFPSSSVGAPHIRDRTYWVADTHDARLEGWRESERQCRTQLAVGSRGVAGIVEYAEGDGRIERWSEPEGRGVVGGCSTGWLADAHDERFTAPSVTGLSDDEHHAQSCSDTGARPGPTNGFWSAADWLACRDNKWRPVEPGTFPLAHGVSSRVGRLRAYGNAINAHQAAEFLRAAL